MKTTRLTIDNKDLYRRYQGIKKRCYNKNYIQYKDYGGRGIKVAEIWLGKDGFYNFVNVNTKMYNFSNLLMHKIVHF